MRNKASTIMNQKKGMIGTIVAGVVALLVMIVLITSVIVPQINLAIANETDASADNVWAATKIIVIVAVLVGAVAYLYAKF